MYRFTSRALRLMLRFVGVANVVLFFLHGDCEIGVHLELFLPLASLSAQLRRKPVCATEPENGTQQCVKSGTSVRP